MNKRRAAFRYVESELYYYRDTKKDIERLREELLSRKGNDENIGAGKSNLPGRPTEQLAIALLTNRKLERMQRVVSAIESIFDMLPVERKQLIQLRYLTKPQTLTWDGIALKLGRDRATVIRWRNEIVSAITDILGIG